MCVGSWSLLELVEDKDILAVVGDEVVGGGGRASGRLGCYLRLVNSILSFFARIRIYAVTLATLVWVHLPAGTLRPPIRTQLYPTPIHSTTSHIRISPESIGAKPPVVHRSSPNRIAQHFEFPSSLASWIASTRLEISRISSKKTPANLPTILINSAHFLSRLYSSLVIPEVQIKTYQSRRSQILPSRAAHQSQKNTDHHPDDHWTLKKVVNAAIFVISPHTIQEVKSPSPGLKVRSSKQNQNIETRPGTTGYAAESNNSGTASLSSGGRGEHRWTQDFVHQFFSEILHRYCLRQRTTRLVSHDSQQRHDIDSLQDPRPEYLCQSSLPGVPCISKVEECL
ncbi:hypothetical protein CVT26_001415 [Gymnopilus dilepis]|uniref:Uncharacterized protein n=1 Tax=Gymnopilus dilepis TaxID=231916 RepID=A0A409WYK5_9AGAR|nr:hypothetical protein CVT26_001415 [Gymnopilus dilepis]